MSMKKLVKIALWIGGIIITILIILISAAAYIGFSSRDKLFTAQQEGIAFAKTTDKEGCLSETALRLSGCEGMCMEAMNFGALCLMNASGDQQAFCSDKPSTDSEYSQGSWQQHCAAKNLSKHGCELFFKTFSAYCRGEFNDK
jgi:hypothetical protein